MWSSITTFFNTLSTNAKIPEETEALMSRFREYIRVPYDPTCPEHEATLRYYWQVVRPHESLDERKGLHWKKLGFQGQDPASDFRGSGIFGLRCLIYFALRYPSTFQSMYSHPITEEKQRYPFSIAGLNILMILYEFLGWGFKQTPAQPLAVHHLIHILFESDLPDTLYLELSTSDLLSEPNPSEFDVRSIFQFDPQTPEGRTERKFCEMFCWGFYRLHQQWFSRPVVSYMDFPTVLENSTQEIQTHLAQHLTTAEQILTLNIKTNEQETRRELIEWN